MPLREFTPAELYHSLSNAVEEGTLTQEQLEEPEWGVSPIFLIEAARNEMAVDRSQYLYPLCFVAGYLLAYFF